MDSVRKSERAGRLKCEKQLRDLLKQNLEKEGDGSATSVEKKVGEGEVEELGGEGDGEGGGGDSFYNFRRIATVASSFRDLQGIYIFLYT